MLQEFMENIGIRGKCLGLVTVRVDDDLSYMLQIIYGVPQGTILGPILFNIYINDLLSIIHRGDVLGFADDTAIFYQAKTWTELKEIDVNDFNLITNWLEYMLLTVNF